MSVGSGGVHPGLPVEDRSRAGIDGKWATLTEEREELKEEVAQLREKLKQGEAKLRETEALVGRDKSELIAELDHLRSLQGSAVSSAMQLDPDEQEAMDHLTGYMRVVVHRWQLKANSSEIAAGVHVLQNAIVQHMLNRLDSERWSSWWGAERKEEA